MTRSTRVFELRQRRSRHGPGQPQLALPLNLDMSAGPGRRLRQPPPTTRIDLWARLRVTGPTLRWMHGSEASRMD